MSKKIGLIENEASYRTAVLDVLREVPDATDVRNWNSAEEFWRDERGHDLDLYLLDIELAHMNGIELAGRIKKRQPDARIIMLTVFASDEMIFRALQAGALGYVLKIEIDRLPGIVRTVLDGGAYMTPIIALRVMQNFQEKSAAPGMPELSDREAQVLELLSTGVSRKQVASQIGVSESTVCFHIRNIYEKLNVRNRVEMVQQATNLGLI